MRSSRHKLKLLRSISRTNGSSGSTPPPMSTNSNNNPPPRQSPHHHESSTPNNRTLRTSNNRSTPKPKPAQYRAGVTITNLAVPTESEENQYDLSPLPRMEGGHIADIRLKAFSICRDYLHGAWKQIDSRDLTLKRVSGGLSNYLYHCSLPQNMSPVGNEPRQVLLRFYGQVHGEDALESLITESVIFALLSERKLGPKLYGVFPGGRIEQFLPARPLLTKELRDPELSVLISQKMAQIHGLNIPISKEASWLWGTMDRWLSNIRDNVEKASPHDVDQAKIIQALVDYKLEDELKWIKKYLVKVGSPVVFSHNDLQGGNILMRPEYETIEEKLVLIDFEYCSYNYRGFDLANHFCEWSYNYNIEAYPNFASTPSDLPTEHERRRFIRNYVAVLRKEYEVNYPEMDPSFFKDSPLFDEEHIMKEVEAFTLASNFFWSLWSFVNFQVSKIPFGYWEHGVCRLETYFRLKNLVETRQY